MGTNYYLYPKPPPTVAEICDCLSLPPSDEAATPVEVKFVEPQPGDFLYEKDLHIGKSSGGWHFSLHVYPDSLDNRGFDKVINTLDDWLPLLKEGLIVNEYNTIITYEEMLEIITKRSWKRDKSVTFDYTSNGAEEGFNGLVRHQIGDFCVGHGSGTWDYIVGEFS